MQILTILIKPFCHLPHPSKRQANIAALMNTDFRFLILLGKFLGFQSTFIGPEL